MSDQSDTDYNAQQRHADERMGLSQWADKSGIKAPKLGLTSQTPDSLDLIAQEANKARLSELEMFKKIEVMDMSPAVAAHISRRYKLLTAENEKS